MLAGLIKRNLTLRLLKVIWVALEIKDRISLSSCLEFLHICVQLHPL